MREGVLHKNKLIIFVFILLILSACANKPLVFKLGLQPKLLELCLDFSREVSGDDKLLHLDAVTTFIDDYNALNKGIRIQSCTDSNKHTVNLMIQKTEFVTPVKQVIYTIISVAGLVYPISGGSFGFIWFGGNTTNLGVTLSDDIASSKKVIYRRFASSPYFMNIDSVKEKHMKEFQTFLFELFDELKLSEREK